MDWGGKPSRRRLLLLLLLLAVSVLLAIESSRLKPDFHWERAKVQWLRLGEEAGSEEFAESGPSELLELDFLSRAEIVNLRAEAVRRYPGLVSEGYQPLRALFGGVVNHKPWWGTIGATHYGWGQRSIAGPSYASRFVNNPLCLIDLWMKPFEQQGQGRKDTFWYLLHLADREPIPADPAGMLMLSETRLRARKAEAVLTYQMSTAVREIDRVYSELQDQYGDYERDLKWSGRSQLSSHEVLAYFLSLIDFGYNFGALLESEGVSVIKPETPQFPLKDRITLYHYCGYPAGCNQILNESLKFKVTRLPATMRFGFWGKKRDLQSPAEFTVKLRLL